MQAACGLMSVTGDTTPVKAGVAVLDVVTGLYASNGLLAALTARAGTGLGQHVTDGLFEASLFAAPEAAASTFSVEDPERGPLRYVRPPLTMSGTPLAESFRPPRLGEHDDEIPRQR